MTTRLLLATALLIAVPGAAQDAGRPGPGWPPGAGIGPGSDRAPERERGPGRGFRGRWAQLSIRERIVIRIPRLREPPPAELEDLPLPRPLREGRAERCLPAAGIMGAQIAAPGTVDLLLDDGERRRAVLARGCPALDYWFGFYIRPTADGLVCAGRDAIRSRSGGACPIVQFRRFRPRRR